MAHIYYEGHSNCRVKDKLTVWIDPFFEGNPLSINDWRSLEKPDIVLITHSHDDHLGQAIEIVKETNAQIGCIFELANHFAAQGIPRENILNYGMGWGIGGTIEHRDIKISMYQSLHTTGHGLAVGFVVSFPSGFTFYHPGDTGLFSDMKLIADRHIIDLAFLPIGDVFTMDHTQAVKAAEFLKAKAVVPIHYKTFPVLEQSPEKFDKELARILPHVRHIPLEAGQSVEYPL